MIASAGNFRGPLTLALRTRRGFQQFDRLHITAHPPNLLMAMQRAGDRPAGKGQGEIAGEKVLQERFHQRRESVGLCRRKFDGRRVGAALQGAGSQPAWVRAAGSQDLLPKSIS